MDQVTNQLLSLHTPPAPPGLTEGQLEVALERVLRTREKRNRDDKGNGSKDIGAALKRFRTGMGVSASTMAKDIGRDPSLIWRIEAGQRGISIETLARITHAYKGRNANVALLVLDILAAVRAGDCDE